MHQLIKLIKNSPEPMKKECFGTMAKLLNLRLPTFYNQIPDVIKLILKQVIKLTLTKQTLIIPF